MTKIDILSINRHPSYIEVTVEFHLAIPSKFSGVANIINILESYGDYVEDSIVGYVKTVKFYSYPIDVLKIDVQQSLVNLLSEEQQKLDNLTLLDSDTLLGSQYDGFTWN